MSPTTNDEAAMIVMIASVVCNTLFFICMWGTMVFSDTQVSAGVAAIVTIMLLLNLAVVFHMIVG